jgi:hypothetical protein
MRSRDIDSALFALGRSDYQSLEEFDRALTSRTHELMRDRSISSRDAYPEAAAEFGLPLLRSPHSASDNFNILWLAVGFLLAFGPGVVSQVVAPGWGATSSSSDATTGGTVYLVLLALSGVGVIAIGFWFGLTGQATEGWRALLRVYFGVTVGTLLSILVVGFQAYDVGGVAAFSAIFIGAPYWLCAGLGSILGYAVNWMRTESPARP